MKRVAFIFVVCSATACSKPPADWEIFRREHPVVAQGNTRFLAGNHDAALDKYDAALRELPSESGIQLNRGLALLAKDDFDRAKEAFLLAAEPPATAEVRALAHYGLGLVRFRQAMALREEQKFDEAKTGFHDAAEEFRKSLRAKPGNRDAGWNLELAELLERETQAQQQEQQQQQQQEQQQQDQQQQDQQQQQQDQQQQDQQQQDQQQQDQQQQQQDQQQQQQDQQQQGQQQQQQDQQQQGQQQPQQDQQQQQQQDQQPSPEEGAEQDRPQPEAGREESGALPPDVSRVLDSLEAGEENLERHRARARARRENRRPTKDW